jgi:hypothetical protein
MASGAPVPARSAICRCTVRATKGFPLWRAALPHRRTDEVTVRSRRSEPTWKPEPDVRKGRDPYRSGARPGGGDLRLGDSVRVLKALAPRRSMDRQRRSGPGRSRWCRRIVAGLLGSLGRPYCGTCCRNWCSSGFHRCTTKRRRRPRGRQPPIGHFSRMPGSAWPSVFRFCQTTRPGRDCRSKPPTTVPPSCAVWDSCGDHHHRLRVDATAARQTRMTQAAGPNLTSLIATAPRLPSPASLPARRASRHRA